MKLRIRDNALRLRLTQAEVSRLALGQVVQQITRFSTTTTLLTEIRPVHGLDDLISSFDFGLILVKVPLDRLRTWASSDEVGITSRTKVDEQYVLTTLIEKDFHCLHSDAEHIEDAYPNPNAGR